MKNLEIYLPFFAGYYEIIDEYMYDIDYDLDGFEGEELSQEIKRLEVEFNCKIDDISSNYMQNGESFEDFKRRFPQYFVECINDEMVNFGIPVHFFYNNMYSPRQYNFETDKIAVAMEFDEQELSKFLLDFIGDNQELVEDWLEDNFKSRDGFSSFRSHHIADWIYSIKKENWNSENIMVEKLIELIYYFESSEKPIESYDDLSIPHQQCNTTTSCIQTYLW